MSTGTWYFILTAAHWLMTGGARVPASCCKIAEMTIWTSRIHTPVDPKKNYTIEPASPGNAHIDILETLNTGI